MMVMVKIEHLKMIFVPLVVMVSFTTMLACSNDIPSADGKGGQQQGDILSEDIDLIASDAHSAGTLDKLQAFELTIYPVVRERCQSCHASDVSPFLAQSDLDAAMRAIIDAEKVDSTNPERSRLVRRLTEDSHNCWGDCQENGAIMLAAVERWVELQKDGAASQDSASHALSLDDSKYLPSCASAYSSFNSIFLDVEAGTPSGNVNFILEDDDERRGGNYALVPDGGAFNDNSTAPGLNFSFEITKTGNYTVHAMMRGASNTNNALRMAIEGVADFADWQVEDQPRDDWRWRPAKRNNVLSSYYFDPGFYTLNLRGRVSGVGVDRLLITNTSMFADAYESDQPTYRLCFDVSDLTSVASSFFYLEVRKLDDTTYIVRRPSLVLPNGSGRVSDVRILLNGTFDPTHNSFRSVTQQINVSGATLLSPATQIINVDQGIEKDKFSVWFNYEK